MEEEEGTDPENLPIYKKAEEIFDVVKHISDLIPEDDEHLQFIKAQMLGDAMMIMAKIAGAEGGDIYDLRMGNAAIIRKAARDLMVTNHSYRLANKMLHIFTTLNLLLCWSIGINHCNLQNLLCGILKNNWYHLKCLGSKKWNILTSFGI